MESWQRATVTRGNSGRRRSGSWIVLLQCLLGGFGSVFPQCEVVPFPPRITVQENGTTSNWRRRSDAAGRTSCARSSWATPTPSSRPSTTGSRHHPHGLRLPPREQPHRARHAPLRQTRHTPNPTKNLTHENNRSLIYVGEQSVEFS